MRGHMPANRYLGIEIEVNQAIPLHAPSHWALLQTLLASAIRDVCLGGT